LKIRVGFFVAGLRVGDIAGNVLQRERLRLQTCHGGGQCIENTHVLQLLLNATGARPHRRHVADRAAIRVPSFLCS
jgi:hypothetical protein